MVLPIIPLAASCLLVAFAIYKFIIYPAFLSPLSKIPNAHWSAPFSSAWILFHRQQQDDTPTIHAAHTRLGPILRLAPNEISVNSIEGGIRTVYAGGYEKGDWYSNVFLNYGVEPMFAMEHHGEHSKRKRMLSNIYAKSTLQKSPAMSKQTEIHLNEKLYPRLKAAAGSGEAFEFYDVFAAVTMDFVSGYIFGMRAGSRFIQDVPAGIKLFHEFKARQKYTFWPQEMPDFTRFMGRIGLRWLLVPTWVNAANDEIEAWLMSLCDGAEQTQMQINGGQKVADEDYPTVYAQLSTALMKEIARSEKTDCSIEEQVSLMRLEIASELLDHTLAGFDTSSITLTWLAWQLSRPENVEWQQRLREEVRTLNGSVDAKDIDNLPILHAILMESLRLHAAIPGNQPRITPPSAVLGDTEAGIAFPNLPPNVRVQAQAWSLHRNPKVFPSPETWDPERWLSSSDKEMNRWFWAFGSGGRMCVGSNLAMLDMKATMVAVWGNFSTEIVDDEGMVPNGGYLAEPIGVGPGGKKGIGGGRKFLKCRLREVEEPHHR